MRRSTHCQPLSIITIRNSKPFYEFFSMRILGHRMGGWRMLALAPHLQGGEGVGQKEAQDDHLRLLR